MLDAELAAKVAETFDLGAEARLTGPVASGKLGDVWKLSTNRGAFAVKDARFPVDPDEVAIDAAYQDQVRGHGVPMPAVVRTPTGEPLVDPGSGPVRVYEWVDVAGRERRLDPGAIGELVAAIHRVVVPAGGAVDPWYVDPVGEPAWHDLAARLREARAPFVDRLEAVLPDVLAAEALLVATEPVQTCHRDLWADNILRSPGDGLVVLDWENSGPGDPAGELGVVLFEFGLGDVARVQTLHASYVGAGGPARLDSPGDLTMLIAQTGHIAKIGCERWLAATTEEDRSDNEAWVGEFLDEPVTAETVEAILDATRG
ncbi:MAG TPA: aminoglycoside phosphotransferase family protein [Nocardioides sp.]|nr:aminoglycoside phosphotransferase family protein [Nocardioides sp.]